MLIFFDTEFTVILPPNGNPAESGLISIGLVDESGDKTFYAELTDTYAIDFRPETHHLPYSSDFVREAVLPHLQGGDYRMTLAELRERLRAWLESFPGQVDLVSDSGVDWQWLTRIYQNSERPENLRSWRHFIPASITVIGLRENYHKNPSHPQHHALHDAIGLQLAWYDGK